VVHLWVGGVALVVLEMRKGNNAMWWCSEITLVYSGLTLIDLAEDNHAGKLGFGISGDGWVEDEDAFTAVSV
jgi:hypothetical protein